MHAAAFEWVERWAPPDSVVVLDIGGRDVNGSPVEAFDASSVFEVVDLHQAENVTWTGDFLAYDQRSGFDVALHLEVAEHAAEWIAHLRHARDLLAVDGVLIFTAAGAGRSPHSAIDGAALRPGEWYQNVDPCVLSQTLGGLFSRHVVDVTGDDVRAVAWR